jgi:hypothetical protein
VKGRFETVTQEEITHNQSRLDELKQTIPTQDGTHVDQVIDQVTNFDSINSEREKNNLNDDMLRTFSPIKFLFTLQDNPDLLMYGLDMN